MSENEPAIVLRATAHGLGLEFLVYSQTCVQRPPLEPEKKVLRAGRYSELFQISRRSLDDFF